MLFPAVAAVIVYALWLRTKPGAGRLVHSVPWVLLVDLAVAIVASAVLASRLDGVQRAGIVYAIAQHTIVMAWAGPTICSFILGCETVRMFRPEWVEG